MASDVTFDFERQRRIGLSEAVLCAGKSPAQIGEIIGLSRARSSPLLLTRLAPEVLAALSAEDQAGLDYDPRSHTAILGPWQAPDGAPQVAVVTAGTSDLQVAREAIRTLAFYHVPACEIADVGVAGLWRILAHDIHHGGELALMLGAQGVEIFELGGLGGHINSPPLADPQ